MFLETVELAHIRFIVDLQRLLCFKGALELDAANGWLFFEEL